MDQNASESTNEETILEEDVDENEYLLDNEKEDALLEGAEYEDLGENVSDVPISSFQCNQPTLFSDMAIQGAEDEILDFEEDIEEKVEANEEEEEESIHVDQTSDNAAGLVEETTTGIIESIQWVDDLAPPGETIQMELVPSEVQYFEQPASVLNVSTIQCQQTVMGHTVIMEHVSENNIAASATTCPLGTEYVEFVAPPSEADAAQQNELLEQNMITQSAPEAVTEVVGEEGKSEKKVFDDDEEKKDDGERDSRFRAERSNIVSLKGSIGRSGKTWDDIPDSLDDVVVPGTEDIMSRMSRFKKKKGADQQDDASKKNSNEPQHLSVIIHDRNDPGVAKWRYQNSEQINYNGYPTVVGNAWNEMQPPGYQPQRYQAPCPVLNMPRPQMPVYNMPPPVPQQQPAIPMPGVMLPQPQRIVRPAPQFQAVRETSQYIVSTRHTMIARTPGGMQFAPPGMPQTNIRQVQQHIVRQNGPQPFPGGPRIVRIVQRQQVPMPAQQFMQRNPAPPIQPNCYQPIPMQQPQQPPSFNGQQPQQPPSFNGQPVQMGFPQQPVYSAPLQASQQQTYISSQTYCAPQTTYSAPQAPMVMPNQQPTVHNHMSAPVQYSPAAVNQSYQYSQQQQQMQPQQQSQFSSGGYQQESQTVRTQKEETASNSNSSKPASVSSRKTVESIPHQIILRTKSGVIASQNQLVANAQAYAGISKNTMLPESRKRPANSGVSGVPLKQPKIGMGAVRMNKSAVFAKRPVQQVTGIRGIAQQGFLGRLVLLDPADIPINARRNGVIIRNNVSVQMDKIRQIAVTVSPKSKQKISERISSLNLISYEDPIGTVDGGEKWRDVRALQKLVVIASNASRIVNSLEGPKLSRVIVKNVGSGNSQTKISKAAFSCGQVKKMIWRSLSSSKNEVEIQFSNSKEANEFYQRYNEKVIESHRIIIHKLD